MAVSFLQVIIQNFLSISISLLVYELRQKFDHSVTLITYLELGLLKEFQH
jgi:hypothetical protein